MEHTFSKYLDNKQLLYTLDKVQFGIGAIDQVGYQKGFYPVDWREHQPPALSKGSVILSTIKLSGPVVALT